MKFLKMLDEHIEEWFLSATLIVMVVLTFTQIVMRSVFSASLSWSEELVRYIFLWQIWVGVSYATKKSKHLRIEMLPNRLSPKNRRKLTVLVDLIWLGFSMFMVIQSFTVVRRLHSTSQLSAALQIPMWIPYLSVLVGFVLMCIRLTQEIVAAIRQNPQQAGEGTA